MLLTLLRNILCPQQMFPSLRSPRDIMGNNVSSFTWALSCLNMSRVTSPIESQEQRSLKRLVCSVVCFQVVILEPLGIFDETSVNGFRILANVEFRKLFIGDVDRHSVPYSCDILIANLESSVFTTMFEQNSLLTNRTRCRRGVNKQNR